MARYEFIASDIHLGAVSPETERAFLAFLEHVGAHGSALLFAGDLFDFWFEYGRVIEGRHFRVLAALASLVDAGIPVTLAGGNHDAWGGRFLTDEVGLNFKAGPFRMELAGRPALVAHGDGLGGGDFRYRALKSILHSRATIGLFRWIHPELGLRIANSASRTETRPDSDPGLRDRAAFIETWARGQLASDPAIAWVVCGHAHMPALIEVEPRRFYLNAGDWLTHFSYITIDAAGTPSLKNWPVASQSAPTPAARSP
ncbi:MAG: UDP-2,3-diacylglucosamine diphosphatase [Longimicrobiales bacterium]